MAIEKDLLDQLLAGRDPKDVFNKDGLVDELKKALSERILNTELDEHLDDDSIEGKSNHRNGYSKKSVLTGTSKMTLSVPRDRAGTFDPKLIAKYQRRFPDFDNKIISMYARGMTVREIRGHLEELYGIEVSPDLISAVTDAVLEEVAEWQNRPLDACFPLVFFDAIRVKIREEGFVRNKAVYIALGILADGTKEILGIWIEQTEGAKFWLRVMNELKTRGVGERRRHPDRRRRRSEGFPTPFFAYLESVRRIIYTTNAIEALNSKLRRAVRTRGHFPNDDAAIKLLYLVLNNAAEEWKRAPREWFEAKTQFAVVFGERFVRQ